MPLGQIEIAKLLRENIALHSLMHWNGFPTWPQLVKATELIWQYFLGRLDNRPLDDIKGSKHLAFVINKYRKLKVPGLLIRFYLENSECEPDKAISTVMRWQRRWFEFRLPKMLMALNNVQESVYKELGMEPGNYKFFAGEIENGFLPPSVSSLREMGIPIEVGRKLVDQGLINDGTTLDELIFKIRTKLDNSKFSEYEWSVLTRV